MKIYSDLYNLEDFTPWSGAVDTHKKICDANMGEAFMSMLDDLFPDGMTKTQLNDLLWFDPEWCLQLVGLDYED